MRLNRYSLCLFFIFGLFFNDSSVATELDRPPNIGPYLFVGGTQVQFQNKDAVEIPTLTQTVLGAGWQYDLNWSAEIAYQRSGLRFAGVDNQFSQTRLSSIYRLTPRIKISWVARLDLIRQNFDKPINSRQANTALGLALGYDIHLSRSIFANISSGPIIGLDGGNTDWQSSFTFHYFFGLRHEEPDEKPEPISFVEPKEDVYYLPQIVQETLPQSTLEPEAQVDAPHELLNEPVAELQPYSDLPLTINFKLNSSLLQPKSMHLLDRLGETLRHAKDFELVVTGHSDETGPTQYNLWLLMRRAERVAKYLMVPNDNSLHRAMNRRVEITGTIVE